MADLEFYTARQCHLCDRLKALIAGTLSSMGRSDVRITEIDIATDPGLTEQYRFRVPVVVCDGEVILEGRPSPEQIRAALSGIE